MQSLLSFLLTLCLVSSAAADSYMYGKIEAYITQGACSEADANIIRNTMLTCEAVVENHPNMANITFGNPPTEIFDVDVPSASPTLAPVPSTPSPSLRGSSSSPVAAPTSSSPVAAPTSSSPVADDLFVRALSEREQLERDLQVNFCGVCCASGQYIFCVSFPYNCNCRRRLEGEDADIEEDREQEQEPADAAKTRELEELMHQIEVNRMEHDEKRRMLSSPLEQDAEDIWNSCWASQFEAMPIRSWCKRQLRTGLAEAFAYIES